MALVLVLVRLPSAADVPIGVVVREDQVRVVHSPEIGLGPEFGVLSVGDLVDSVGVVGYVLLGDLLENQVCVGNQLLCIARGGF